MSKNEIEGNKHFWNDSTRDSKSFKVSPVDQSVSKASFSKVQD